MYNQSGDGISLSDIRACPHTVELVQGRNRGQVKKKDTHTLPDGALEKSSGGKHCGASFGSAGLCGN